MATAVDARFRAMGSDAHVIVVGGNPGLIDDARQRIAELEGRWSRFIDSSEVCEINRHAGDDVTVSPDTAMLVTRAIEAWRLTGGGFDPTLLGAVLRAGYDVSFEQIASARPTPTSDLLAGCTDIEVRGSTVRLPSGTGFDPGGIGKGLATDLVLADLVAAGAEGVCVNLGGDLRVSGPNPDGEAWTIALEHPLCEEPVAMIGLHAGAIATSTTLKRRWELDGVDRHHLIDPATGEPSDTDLVLCTAIAGEAWIAEVMAKAVLLRGADRAFDIVDDSMDALTIDRDGVVRMTPGFQRFTGGAR
jgi:thiamine biosynthesis lipoprotein